MLQVTNIHDMSEARQSPYLKQLLSENLRI